MIIIIKGFAEVYYCQVGSCFIVQCVDMTEKWGNYIRDYRCDIYTL